MLSKILRFFGFKQHVGLLVKTFALDNIPGNHPYPSIGAKVYICKRCKNLAVSRVSIVGESIARFPTRFCKGQASWYGRIVKKNINRFNKIIKKNLRD